MAWKLRRVCHEFLEENDKDWAKRKVARIEEQKRIERIEKMKILSRNAKIAHIEKAIEDGLNKIPAHEKEKLETEEKAKRTREMHEIKQGLWRLRKKEKKLENKKTEKIRKMTKKLETIK